MPNCLIFAIQFTLAATVARRIISGNVPPSAAAVRAISAARLRFFIPMFTRALVRSSITCPSWALGAICGVVFAGGIQTIAHGYDEAAEGARAGCGGE